jgi:hypothetical protein
VRLWNRLVRAVTGPHSGSDAGQMSIALIVVVFFGLVMVVFRFGLPWGQAADQKAGSQASADAAALAAAEEIKKDLPDRIDDALRRADDRRDLEELLSFLRAGDGRNGAIEYADLNNADIRSYTYDWRADRISVKVESRAETSGQHSVSTAQARLGLRLQDCRLDDDELPPTIPPPPPDPDDPPVDDEPAPDVGTQLRCGDLVLHFTINGENGRPRLDSSLAGLDRQFRIGLTG